MNLILIEIKNVFYVFNMVLSMKVLRIKALGIPFFKEELNIQCRQFNDITMERIFD